MDEDIFDGISLDDLANLGASEDEVKVEKPTRENKESKNKEVEEELVLDPDAISIDELINAGATVEEEPKDKTKKPANANSSSSSVTSLTSFASDLREAGILDDLEDEQLSEIDSYEKLVDVIATQIKANEFKALNENQKLYLQALESGIPEEDFANNRKNVNRFTSIKDEDLMDNKQKQLELIYQDLLLKGIDKEDATKLALMSAKEDDSLKTALKAKQSIIKYIEDDLRDEIKAREDAKKQEALDTAKRLSELETKITKSDDLVPGIKINKTVKDKVFASITKPIGVSKSGDQLNEVTKRYSEDHDYQMRLHALHILTNGFTDFSKLTNEIKTKTIKGLKEEFNNLSSGSRSAGNPNGLSANKIIELIPTFK